MEFINSLTPHQYYLLGGLFASIPAVIALTEWTKRHHVKVKATELWSGFVVLNVTFWSIVLTTADAVSNNLGQITSLGKLIPTIAPFVSQYAPTVSVVALTVHTVAVALKKWWVDRKNNKPLNIEQLPDLAPAVQAVTTAVPANSFGTEAAQKQPAQHVIQL